MIIANCLFRWFDVAKTISKPPSKISLRLARYVPVSDLDHEDVVDTEKLAEVFGQLGERVFVKDYVKSVCGKNWVCRRENCVSVAGARRVLEQIVDERGESFAGGYTFKRWMDIDDQVRLFVVDTISFRKFARAFLVDFSHGK